MVLVPIPLIFYVCYQRCSDAALMLDTNAPLSESGLANQDVQMHNPDVHLSELHSMPGPSSDINMQQFVCPGLPLNQPFSPGILLKHGRDGNDGNDGRHGCMVVNSRDLNLC